MTDFQLEGYALKYLTCGLRRSAVVGHVRAQSMNGNLYAVISVDEMG